MRYYTIWLVLVKSFFVPFLGIGKEKIGLAIRASPREIQNPHLKAERCCTRRGGELLAPNPSHCSAMHLAVILNSAQECISSPSFKPTNRADDLNLLRWIGGVVVQTDDSL